MAKTLSLVGSALAANAIRPRHAFPFPVSCCAGWKEGDYCGTMESIIARKDAGGTTQPPQSFNGWAGFDASSTNCTLLMWSNGTQVAPTDPDDSAFGM